MFHIFSNKVIPTIFGTFCCVAALAQNKPVILPEDFSKHVRVADSLMTAGNYALAADNYRKAFSDYKWKGPVPDRLNAARAYAYTGQNESALAALQLLCETERFFDYPSILKDKAFEGLRNDPRFKQVLQCIRASQQKHAPKFNPELRDQLLALKKEDQEVRSALDAVIKRNAPATAINEISTRMLATDSANIAFVADMLDHKGWPDKFTVDFTGCDAIFLIIQHAPLETQKKYLPMIQQAAKTLDIPPPNLALLTDRISVRENGTQLYGTQITMGPSGEKIPFPITDEAGVNKRRKAIGLPPLEDYLKMLGITYVPKQ